MLVAHSNNPFHGLLNFQKMLADIEFENSMKSDHEIRHERDLLMAEKLKKGDMELDLDETIKQTAQDMEDAYADELKKFEFAPRRTDADKQKDHKSLDRQLDQTLVLLVEQQIGNQKHYMLPQGPHQPGETLRETAERVIKEQCGDNSVVQVYGNSPVGFYKYKYPVNQRKVSVGAKIFFYRSVLSNTVNDKTLKIQSGFEWLTSSELKSKPIPSEYLNSVRSFVL